MYLCIDDSYDPNGSTYDGPEDFRAMCLACFNEAPDLQETADGYIDETGMLVLQVIPVDA